MKKSVLFLLCCLLWTVASQAQHTVGIWKSGVSTIVNEIDSLVFNATDPVVGVWKGGVPSIVNGPDSIIFNNEVVDNPDGVENVEIAEPTKTETLISQLSADEENSVATVFTAEEKEQYDAMAEELLAMFDTDGNEARRYSLRRVSDEDYASEVIRKNGSNNVLGGELQVEQPDWDCGTWGPTRYGGFKTFYRTFVEGTKRYILIVFKQDGGFQHNRRAYVKLGQLNNGKGVGKLGMGTEGTEKTPYVPIAKGQEYVYQRVCIDDFLDDYGYLTLFPLIITEVDGEPKGERNYINPIFIYTPPYAVPEKWRFMHYGDIFGKVNGVPVYCNTWEVNGVVQWAENSKGKKFECWNLYGKKYQCVELCKRYIIDFYKLWPESYGTGHAYQWPDNRRADPDNFTVYPNDGTAKVREGDFIVWDSGGYGHIGLVFRTGPDYVKVAHQNGYNGSYAYPINTTLTIDNNGIVRDLFPNKNFSPVNSSVHTISHIIHVNINEKSATPVIDPEPGPDPEPEPVKAMSCDVTSLDFGEIAVGEEKKMIFNVTNTGDAMLTFSPMVMESSGVFSVSNGPQTLARGNGQGYTVIFKPTAEGTFTGKITIRTDAANHPEWTITLTGKAKSAEQWGEKKMVFSCAFENTQFNLYKQPNMAKYRTNSAGTKFYQSRLILEVMYDGKTGTSTVTSNVYIDPNNNYQLGMAFDEGGWGTVAIFASSKAEGVNNLMDGYGFMAPYFTRSSSPIFFDDSGKETIFQNENNWGWYPSFFYDSYGYMGVRHLSLADNYEYESTIGFQGWEHFPYNYYSKSTYENMWKNMRKPQFLDRPENNWYY